MGVVAYPGPPPVSTHIMSKHLSELVIVKNKEIVKLGNNSGIIIFKSLLSPVAPSIRRLPIYRMVYFAIQQGI